jgi:hypothetical protein
MSFSVNPVNEAFVASGDLSLCLNRIVQQLTTDFKVGLSTAGLCVGVLQNAPKDGEFASVATDGVCLVRVGAAVTAGDYITAATSGWGIKTTNSLQIASGSWLYQVEVLGKVRAGAASGMLAAVDIDLWTRVGTIV